jgi:ABC-type Fe3+-hydroxamate transport system substrate-binding protein
MERIFTDQMNRTVRLGSIPSRIVSLVPSQTELLYDLGLNDEVVGITKFCVYPEEWFKSKIRVGGTKKVDIEKVAQLKPDLIIGNKEENTESDILELEKIAPVWMSDIYTVEDALNMILELGEIIGKVQAADKLCKKIKDGFCELEMNRISGSFLYFIWKEPDYLAGTNTYISDLLEKTGLDNLCRIKRYPEYSVEMGKPDHVFLSSEPYPFKIDDLDVFRMKFPGSKVHLIDGEMCSWYGSRMYTSTKYLRKLSKTIGSLS